MPHLTRLAEDPKLCIMLVNPYDLRDALDASTDLRHDDGDTMEDDFPVLMVEKHRSATRWFHDDLALLGVQEPVTIIIMRDGSWQLDDGHHRLMWCLLNNIDVPVVFDDTGAGEDSTVRYEVQRIDVEAFHYTEGIVHARTVRIAPVLPTPRARNRRKPLAQRNAS